MRVYANETKGITMKKCNKFGRRKFFCYYMVILMSFWLIQWQYFSKYSASFLYQMESLETLLSNQQQQPSMKNLTDGDSYNHSFSTNESTSSELSTVDLPITFTVPIYKKQKLYQVIERYLAEDKLLFTNAKFKRILFWNEVWYSLLIDILI
jgi:hypothetical protein